MLLVYIPGIWDLLHAGHVKILKRARALGDRLVVGVPSDEVVMADKGRKPVVSLEDRMEVLSELRCVDIALPYYRLEFLTHLDMLHPDILVVGEGWGNDERHLDAERWVTTYNRRFIVLPRTLGISTSSIRETVVNDALGRSTGRSSNPFSLGKC